MGAFLRLLLIAAVIAGLVHLFLTGAKGILGKAENEGSLPSPTPSVDVSPASPLPVPQLEGDSSDSEEFEGLKQAIIQLEEQNAFLQQSVENFETARDMQAEIRSISGVHVFKNRTVPNDPFRDTDIADNEISVMVDRNSNAWLYRGAPAEVRLLENIARQLDKREVQQDLDFVLLAMSQDFLSSLGLSAVFRDGFLPLAALSLSESRSGFDFVVGETVISGEFARSNGLTRIVSAPVVRVLAGEEFSFGADQQIPVPVRQVSDGVATTSVQYYDVGLELSGRLIQVADKFRLSLEQRNGSLGRDVEVSDGVTVPQTTRQTLKTSVELTPNKWAVVGGVRSLDQSFQKRLFGRDSEESTEILLVFVRARDALGPAPESMPALPAGIKSRFSEPSTWGESNDRYLPQYEDRLLLPPIDDGETRPAFSPVQRAIEDKKERLRSRR